MQKFIDIVVTIVFIVWLLFVPFQLNFMQYVRWAHKWEQKIQIKVWLELLKGYVPGLHSRYLEIRNPNAVVTWELAGIHWRCFFSDVTKGDLIAIIIITIIFLGFLYMVECKFEKRFIQAGSGGDFGSGKNVTKEGIETELKPMKIKEAPKAKEESQNTNSPGGVEVRKADKVTNEEKKDKKDVWSQELDKINWD